MKTLLAPLTIIGLIVAVVVGCGSDEDNDTIKIGMILPATGDLETYGPAMEQGVRLAVSQINDAGGLLGREVEPIFRDSKTDPTATKAAAEELIGGEGVPAIVGAAGSGNTLAASEVTIPGGVVLISGSATSPSITGVDDSGYLFRTVPHDAFQALVLANLVSNDGHTSAAVLYVDNAYGSDFATAFDEDYKANGHSVTVAHAFPENPESSHDFQADLAAVYAGNPAAIVMIAYAGHAIDFFKTWNTNGGFSGQWYVTDGVKSESIADNVGTGVLTGVIGTAPAPVEGVSVDFFRTTYRERFSEDPGIFSENYYDAMMLIGLAIAEAGDATGSSIRDALSEVAKPEGMVVHAGEAAKALEEIGKGNAINYEGASGPVDFDENGDVSGPVEIWHFNSSNEIEQDEIVIP